MVESRLFIKVHHGFPEHWKTTELSDKAFRHLVEAWCFCARNMNDGKITNAQRAKLFTPKTFGELVKVGYIIETDSGAEMHQYLSHQMSASDIADLRSKRQQAGSMGGKAKAKGVASAIANGKQTPSKSLPEVEVEEELELKANTKAINTPSATPSVFDEFWAVYPRKEDKAKAKIAYGKALQSTGHDDILEGAQRYRDDPNREPEYTKHPTTWLNAGSWENEPLPVRRPTGVATRQTPTDRARAGLELARSLAEPEHQYAIGM